MRFLYAVFLVCACTLSAAAEDPFPAADALLPQHQQSAASGPAFTLDEIEQMALVGNPEFGRVGRLAVVEAHVPTAGASMTQCLDIGAGRTAAANPGITTGRKTCSW